MRDIRCRGLGFLSLFGVWLFLPALGMSGAKAGENGAAFLKIGAGARPAALGDAFTAVADDAYAAVWNPAGLARLARPEIGATHTQWLQGGRHDALVAAYPTRGGTFGVSAVTLSYGDIEKRTEDTDEPDSTFGSLDAAYSVSYGNTVGEKLSLGLGLTYIRQTLDSVSAGAPAATVGALWHTPVSHLTVGAAVRNIGGSIQYSEEGDPLPTTAALGAAGRFVNNRLLVSAETRWVRNETVTYGGGCEVSPPIYKDAVGRLRAGYRTDTQDVTDASGASLGLGVAFPRWNFDVTWTPYGVLGDTFRYAFRFVF
jgi:hypothetical protein